MSGPRSLALDLKLTKMPESSDFMKQLLNVFSCSRRNTPSARRNVKVNSGFDLGKKKRGTSVGYRSNVSTDLGSEPAGSTTDSDTETISSRRTHKSLNARPPPGLSLQSGRSGQKTDRPRNEDWRNPGVTKTAARGCGLADCLREITESSGNDVPSSFEEVLKRRIQRENEPTQGLPGDLQNVLSKLSSSDAAVVKAALMGKGALAPHASRPIKKINQENTLRANLQKLASIDAKRVFMVRKIQDLGLMSSELLNRHFSKIGCVEDVLVSHSVDKRNMDPNDPEAQPVVRPATVGFIVMKSADDVDKIFKQGLQQKVGGANISLTAYEHHVPDDVIRNESKFGLPPAAEITNKIPGPRFPTYANITENNTLRSNLRKLAEVDADRVFMVRKINKLGLGSAQLLKTYFGQIGGVTNVYVTHSIDRRKIEHFENPNAKPVVRPAGIGFVVMDKAEDVATVFQNGKEQMVYGVKIGLSPYEHHIPDEAASHDDGLESQAAEELER